jgi:hypothetical protein
MELDWKAEPNNQLSARCKNSEHLRARLKNRVAKPSIAAGLMEKGRYCTYTRLASHDVYRELKQQFRNSLL